MKFDLEKSIEILERTPKVLISMLSGLSRDWIENNEGTETWSPYDVVGHFIQGEKKDWIPRAKIILSDVGNKEFVPFDRFAQFEASKGKTLVQLLEEFESLRIANIEKLRALKIREDQLKLEGIHPAFGKVTLEQLLSTWVVHDLNHISQISRVMASQYKKEAGPWNAYLRILNS
ncbi:DinB family protein [Gillisia marina]|uniref:DinB family protein n=1 Tax=Gillisia marina TaxID=1167637 RepID=UPI00029A9C40|nr:DinB family protein [Gillisia marina]